MSFTELTKSSLLVIENNNNNNSYTTRAFIVFLRSKDDISKIQKEVDNLFPDYIFYPELDWDQYGYRPPEGHQVLGAWRHLNSELFIFLLDNPHMMSFPPAYQVLFHLAGDISLITKSQRKLNQLKASFALSDKEAETLLNIEKRLSQIGSSKHFKILFTILTLITISLNTIAFFIRKQPVPEFDNLFLTESLRYLMISVYFFAIISQIIVMFICIILFVKFGILFIRRL